METTMPASQPTSLILPAETDKVSDGTQGPAESRVHSVVSLAHCAGQYYENDEFYCSECYNNILHWRASDDEERGAHQFHLNILTLLECGKTCKLCAYICSLFGDTIHNYADDHSNLPIFHIAHDAPEPWITSDGTFKAVILTVGVYPWEYRESSPGFRRLTVTTSAGPLISREVWAANPVDLAARSATLRNWLVTCQTCHPRCNVMTGSGFLSAARIISIHMSGSGTFQLKLIRPSSLESAYVQYTVLSHCWGGIDIPCQTTTKTITAYESEGLRYGDLPKTFQDAIHITAALKIQFVWIDSLCIIQDDLLDWEREAFNMSSIFRGATLTISATSAHNCHEGCGLATTFAPAVQFRGTRKAPMHFAAQGFDFKYKDVLNQLAVAPVNRRAWIFQEALLSRRILHATNAQFVWQCETLAETEDGLLSYDGKRWDEYQDLGCRLKRPAPNYAKARSWTPKWREAVYDYTKRALSRPSDTYAAFAGVVRYFQELSGQEPLIGLWRGNLHQHLAWTVENSPPKWPEKNSKTAAMLLDIRVRRPSWTWMSFPHNSVNIIAPEADRSDVGTIYEATVLKINVQWSGQPLTSIPTGTLLIRGICAPASHENGSRVRKIGTMHLDPGLPKDTHREANVELLALHVDEKSQAADAAHVVINTTYLVIQPTGVGPDNEYVRIGSMYSYQRLSLADALDYQTPGVWKDILLV